MKTKWSAQRTQRNWYASHYVKVMLDQLFGEKKAPDGQSTR